MGRLMSLTDSVFQLSDFGRFNWVGVTMGKSYLAVSRVRDPTNRAPMNPYIVGKIAGRSFRKVYHVWVMDMSRARTEAPPEGLSAL